MSIEAKEVLLYFLNKGGTDNRKLFDTEFRLEKPLDEHSVPEEKVQEDDAGSS